MFTGADVMARGLGAVPFRQFPDHPLATPLKAPPRYPLMPDVVRYVGDNVAMVVAGTPDQAADGAEAVVVDYQVLPAVVDPRHAVAGGAPEVWSACPNNIAGVWEEGDGSAVDAAFAVAPHTVSVDLVNNRLIPNSLEPRGARCAYDAESGRTTLTLGCQMPHLLKQHLAEDVLHIPPEKLRVVVPDMGGGFGLKVFCYPEYAALAMAAEALGRTVRWQATRAESFLSDIHGRDQFNRADLAFNEDGKFLALRQRNIGSVGAYLSFQGGFIPTLSSFRVLTSVYDIPLAHARCDCVLTHTGPTDAYRGAGRPEAVYVMERLADLAAAHLKIDPVELRRRNLVAKSAMPYRNAMGMVIDSGDFEGVMNQAQAQFDWAGFEGRRQEAEAAGKLLGRGLAMFIEHTGRNEHTETVNMDVDSAGRVRVYSGTQEMGQGLKTSYVQLVAERLEVPPETIEIIQGDTDLVASGGGSGGSRSLFVGGSAVAAASVTLLETARALAGELLEVSVADLDYAGGRFTVTGTDRALDLGQIAGGQTGGLLDATETVTAGGLTWPNGCHISEVEIDRDTGRIRVSRYGAVDDVGRVVNAMIVDGQVQGGIAQGIGQALLEHTVFDGNGQLLSGSLMDYALPRADDLPWLETSHDESSPCTTNPLGAKGAGECGATGAPPAVVSAVLDALRPFGVTHLEMPIRAETVWQILQNQGQ